MGFVITSLCDPEYKPLMTNNLQTRMTKNAPFDKRHFITIF